MPRLTAADDVVSSPAAATPPHDVDVVVQILVGILRQNVGAGIWADARRHQIGECGLGSSSQRLRAALGHNVIGVDENDRTVPLPIMAPR